MKSPEDECDKHLFEDEVQLYTMYNLYNAIYFVNKYDY